ncbi:SDR family NAD(P)-dependent oxidoreductase [Streptomyces smyrnaeus]|uniref:SDR family NAD(P)-dependent oxidoreductase n=1 Tax=Streptomyces TaxID=1883 RepID=UPI001B36DA9E|nr:SDR family NAD(P)-dependent oxidoreductase [Streptomyces sp. B15]MBQ1119324.1 SDR family NAD(P)-dependent oxidoreductase [Streptomyces sp. B15]
MSTTETAQPVPTTPITLITGAGRGLGRETARRLHALGHIVYLGVRDPERGERTARETGGRVLPLDVTSEQSVQEAAALLREREGHLDVLVNNAGVSGALMTAEETTADNMSTVYDTNVFGVVRTTRAFLPLLHASQAPVVVNVSSGLGCISAVSDGEARAVAVPDWMPALTYASSKAALNMVTAQYAHALPRFRVNAVDPGYTATDFNGHSGRQPVSQGAEIIVRMACVGLDGPTGGYFAEHGRLPW